MKKCPECGSEEIKLLKYMEADCIVCRKCGYDECKALEVYPEGRSSQKAKGRYSPYRTGGGQRSTRQAKSP